MAFPGIHSRRTLDSCQTFCIACQMLGYSWLPWWLSTTMVHYPGETSLGPLPSIPGLGTRFVSLTPSSKLWSGILSELLVNIETACWQLSVWGLNMQWFLTNMHEFKRQQFHLTLQSISLHRFGHCHEKANWNHSNDTPQPNVRGYKFNHLPINSAVQLCKFS